MSIGKPLLVIMNTLAASLLAAGCAVTPYSQKEIDTYASEVPTRLPMRTFTPTESLLTCLGGRLRDMRIPPVLIGIGVADTTGKTGVDQALLMRSALQKIAAGGSGLKVTNMGVGPAAPTAVNPQTPEERLRGKALPGVKAPDLVIEGGVISVRNAGIGDQKNFGLGGRDVDLTNSRTRTVDEVRLGYGLKRFSDGVDLPGSFIDLKVVYQQASTSSELGAFLAFRIDNKSRGVGLRMGSTSHKNESAEDAIRTGVEAAAAILISEQFSVDIHNCPVPSLDETDSGDKKDRPPSMNDLAQHFHAMTVTERVRWIQNALISKHYLTIAADGQNGPQTQDAIRRYEQSLGLPPTGGQPTLGIFLELAREQILTGADIRARPAPTAGRPAEIKFVPSHRFDPYEPNEKFTVDIVAPQSGWLYCYFFTPGGEVSSVFPSIAGRPGFVSGRAAVPLFGGLDGGRFGEITLDESGLHVLYCAESRTSLANILPAPLRPGNRTRGWSIEKVRSEIRSVAGSNWISDGQVTVRVSPRSTQIGSADHPSWPDVNQLRRKA